MRPFVVLLVLFFLAAGTDRLQAQQQQSMDRSSWKLYMDALHDTITLHIRGDSSFTSISSGEVVVRCVCKVSKDTLRIKDVSGIYACMDGEGVYKMALDGNFMSITLIADPCDNRSGSIAGTRWKRGED